MSTAPFEAGVRRVAVFALLRSACGARDSHRPDSSAELAQVQLYSMTMLSGLHIALCVLAIGPPEMFSSFSPSAEAHRLVFHHRLNLTVTPVEHTASSRRFANCSAGVEDPSRKVCCNAACGLCGGRGCSGRPGGPRQCCVPPILRTGRVCESQADVACILRGSSSYIRGDGVEHRGSSGAVLAAAGGESTQPASTQPASTQPASLAVLAAAGGESTQSASRAPMKLHPRLPSMQSRPDSWFAASQEHDVNETGCQLVQQKSRTVACTRGESFGCSRRGVWVSKGCRGVFRSMDGEEVLAPHARTGSAKTATRQLSTCASKEFQTSSKEFYNGRILQ